MKPTEHIALEDGRFHRQSMITWWDQQVLAHARILVVGAGALGNEILKNLALAGVGNIFLVDLDTIERSNLSRTVLFRAEDVGRSKVAAAAEALKNIYPHVKLQTLHGNVVYDLGLGVFRWANLVIGGLDNREARLEINRSCFKTGTPWIDGAIEALNGQMRLFAPPDGPCYECTMSRTDWKMLNRRRSCTLLSRDDVQAGKVPTVSTVSSIIAGLQCQEAIKWLHGISDFAGKGMVFNGRDNEFYQITYKRKSECYSHERFDRLVPLSAGVADLTVGEVLERARAELGSDAVLELNADVLRELECPKCRTTEQMLTSLGKVTERTAECPQCGTQRIAHLMHELDAECGLLDKTSAQVGIPPFDIIAARCDQQEIHPFFDGDARAVLGELANGD